MLDFIKPWIASLAALMVLAWAHGASASPANGAVRHTAQPDGRYTELRLALGFGGIDAARPANASNDEGSTTAVSITASVLGRRDALVFGDAGALIGELFGGEHTYLGAQARLSIDPGAAEHLALDFSLAGRFDLVRREQAIVTGSCWSDCDGSTETWSLGGYSIDVSMGLRYLF